MTNGEWLEKAISGEKDRILRSDGNAFEERELFKSEPRLMTKPR